MKILVVDDMASMRNVMVHMLKSIGNFQTDEAACGKEAIRLLNDNKYDLLITDYHMPNINGVQLLKYVRNKEAHAKLPVLMVTCEDQRKEIKTIIEAKVSGFIVKPFNANTLIKQLNKIPKLTKLDITAC